ncbi:hypothetical protein [Chryseosolibacter indicus]|uniref:Uncharacterized protein n=1 Tax=Chryseosolibacter indicus TaxID=2782351 RepID=A0ABS5VPJ7_9BACT|nr:hypothetical protein [Chryseosolibacter indicus]MBT1703338.1 hypothetical protein [Chryseosolibacter indicus]
MTSKTWLLPEYFTQNIEKLDTSFLQLTMEQSDKFLSEIAERGENLTKRAYTTLGIALAALLGLLVYATVCSEKISALYLAACMSIPLCILTVAILLFKGINSYDHLQKRYSPPEVLFKSELIEGFTRETQKKNLLMTLCINYGERIDTSSRLNNQRTFFLNATVYMLALIPFNVIFASLFLACVP